MLARNAMDLVMISAFHVLLDILIKMEYVNLTVQRIWYKIKSIGNAKFLRQNDATLHVYHVPPTLITVLVVINRHQIRYMTQALANASQIIRVIVDKVFLQLYQVDSMLILRMNNVSSAILYAKHAILILENAHLAGDSLINFRQEAS